ncbi:phospholipase D-like domain-containing protein [Asticcacaulis sp. 201]|uniref:phospholipase D-like domain-containing protein n=1 Tax=Asticcacaulis sp. 201 TaxID=3028787 RepID=UPI002916A257|nr:phospholipase D-like domain-containing protein [Asticcacaulis sp. 201]MDV6329956.1 phospholipase D-like domain-containing protein [Asticcacaulis sp. 201]
MDKRATNGATVLVAYQGDAKTLLAFDLTSEASRDNLAGFTIQVTPPGQAPYYLLNDLRFETPGHHAQDPKESAFSTINAPIHKFRWVHVPGSAHQGLEPSFGPYTYAVTPRYFDARGAMLPLDAGQTATVAIDIAPFVKGSLAIGFTRGFTQSQAFTRHFGLNALIRPKDAPLQFDTSQVCGANAQGEQFTYAQQYEWSGWTARKLIFDLLNEVKADARLRLDMFAYDLNEPDLITLLLDPATAKRTRVILDNATLHHSTDKPKPEDEFEALFKGVAGAGQIKRGHFTRYAHDKVFVVYHDDTPIKVLTGSTNFSVTGMYVNSNHVLQYTDPDVAKTYADVFQESWDIDVHAAAFAKSKFATQRFAFAKASLPATAITFSPHDDTHALQYLTDLVSRVEAEAKEQDGSGSVLFAVMELDGGPDNPVYKALAALHDSQSLFSFGISDNLDGIYLYRAGQVGGVLVTGKPVNTQLPPPFNQVRNISGVGHQIHHKFVVCGFNGSDPTVYCGSSNLALKGEEVNGDNLLAIRDADVATVFAIEALGLVDHFNFLNGVAKGPKSQSHPATAAAPAIKQQAAVAAGWFLGTTDAWAHKFFDPHDMHCKDRELFVR